MGNVFVNNGYSPSNAIGSGYFEYGSWATGKYTDCNEIKCDEHIFVANIKNLPTGFIGSQYGFLDVKTYDGYSFSPSNGKRLIHQTFTLCNGENTTNMQVTRMSYDDGETWSEWQPINAWDSLPYIYNINGTTLGFDTGSEVSVHDFFEALSNKCAHLDQTTVNDVSNAYRRQGSIYANVQWLVAAHIDLCDANGNRIHFNGGFVVGYVSSPNNAWAAGCINYTSNHDEASNYGKPSIYKIWFRTCNEPDTTYSDGIDFVANPQQSSPNLFDNPDFKINQDGQTVYNTGSTTLNYAMDRWRGHPDYPLAVTIGSDHINVAATIAGSPFYQPLENIIWGKEMSMTIYCRGSGSISFGQYSVRRTISLTSDWHAWSTSFVSQNTSSIGIWLNDANMSVGIAYMKLEYGKPTTYVTPDPIEEVKKCWRYYVVPKLSTSTNVDPGVNYNTLLTKEDIVRMFTNTYLPVNIQLPVPMRVSPTLTVGVEASSSGVFTENHGADWMTGALITEINLYPHTTSQSYVSFIRASSSYANEDSIPDYVRLSFTIKADARL